jgi:hypothetical protein
MSLVPHGTQSDPIPIPPSAKGSVTDWKCHISPWQPKSRNEGVAHINCVLLCEWHTSHPEHWVLNNEWMMEAVMRKDSLFSLSSMESRGLFDSLSCSCLTSFQQMSDLQTECLSTDKFCLWFAFGRGGSNMLATTGSRCWPPVTVGGHYWTMLDTTDKLLLTHRADNPYCSLTHRFGVVTSASIITCFADNYWWTCICHCMIIRLAPTP